jgi:hypothetical protein
MLREYRCIITEKEKIMPSKDFIPAADAAFNTWQYQLADAIGDHATAWGIPATAVTQLQNQRGNWDGAYSWVTNPATKTKARILAKNEARKEYVAFLRALLKQYITYNPAVSDEDRVNMGLPIHDTKPTPVPPPSTRPEFEFEIATRQIKIHFRDAGSESRAKPKGVAGAVIYYEIRETPPADQEDLRNSVFTGRTPYSLEFHESDRGKRVYFAIRWQNAKGDKGPWSELQNAVIP